MWCIRSINLLLVAVTLLIPTTYGLQCYSCSTDGSDLNCDDISVLETITCQAFSTNHPVQPVCGYKRLVESSNTSSERIWRGCAIGGECALLSRQGNEAFNSLYQMAACEECNENDCNGQRSTGLRASIDGVTWWCTVGLVVALLSKTG
ncbi:uncharacterized protein LOC128731331 [Anopheles nili]|uniref:uncharacterized protein LOC128731331 n=1 Tax=Anopheles nili TaxID=185578 RepID=UPI00237A5248|nr:uncharacterized protein LOC128731331 [Anopheles nili]